MSTPRSESKAHRFFSGKGFYIALAVSLVAVGGAAWLGVNSAINQLESDGETPIENNSTVGNDEWQLPSDFEAAAPQSDVPAPASEPEPPVSSAPSEPAREAGTAVRQGYILPIKGEILNTYSGDSVVLSKTLSEWVMHTGIDLSAEVGAPVKAMSSGKVLEVVNDDLWGTTVTIDHGDGILSWYANLQPALQVKAGQAVKLGSVLGVVGETAAIEHAEASHLHFGVKQNGDWIDPTSICK